MNSKGMPLPLEVLNRRARACAFGIEALDWSLGVDRAKAWMPEALAPLSFAPSYAALDAQQRLRCNQLQALALAEKFIWFERLLVRIVNAVRFDAGMPPELAQALADFVAEETKHTAMFGLLLCAAEPAWYGAGATRLFTVSRPQRWATALAAACPHTLLVWIWLAAFVEERTVMLARACAHCPAGALDPLHRHVHALHLRDEVRHCQLDSHLLARFYDSEPAWKKRLAAVMLRRLLAGSMRADAASPNVVRQLGLEFGQLRQTLVPRLLAELRQLQHDPAYRDALFGSSALPRFRALLGAHPEHAQALALLPSRARP